LPVCTRCRGEGHGHPRSISTELVCDGLTKRLGPVVHFRFDRHQASRTQAEKIRTTSKNRNFHSDGKPGALEPSRDRFGQFGFEAERHVRSYLHPREKLLVNPARDPNGPRVRGREHPSLAVRLRPLRIQRSHVVPGGRRIEMPHQDVFRVPRFADDEERRKAESTLRDLMRRHRSSHGVESTELPLGGHGPCKFAGLFQPSCVGHDPWFYEGRAAAFAGPPLPRTSCGAGTYAKHPWLATCTSSGPPDRASRRWCTPSSCG